MVYKRSTSAKATLVFFLFSSFWLECDMGKYMLYILFPFNILFYIHMCVDFIYNWALRLSLVPLEVWWRESRLQVIVTHNVTAKNWIWFSERAVYVLNCLAAFHLLIYIFKLWEMQGNMIILVTEYEVLMMVWVGSKTHIWKLYLQFTICLQSIYVVGTC